MGESRRFDLLSIKSVLPRTSDVSERGLRFAFVPIAEVAALLDHLFCAGEDGRGQRYAKVASDSPVDGQLEAGRVFYRQIGGLSAAGDRVDVVNPAVSRAGKTTPC